MKAFVYKKFGEPGVLKLVNMKKPSPGYDEVLVKIKATTVTAADCYMRRGDTLASRLVLGLFYPRERYQILGTEFSGTIESIGSGVKKFKPGDDIFAFRGFGTGCYAGYKCMKEKGSIAIKPAGVSFSEAAAAVDGATTALFFLREKAAISKGQKVLINGASGSIGTFAVQIAKFFGARVTAVCSTRNGSLVKSLGADKVVDYKLEDFTRRDEKYDIVFDTVGKSSFKKCKPVLPLGGKYLTTVMNPRNVILTLLSRFSGKKAIFGMSVNKTSDLNVIKTMMEGNHLKSVIDRSYKFEDLPAAHAYVEQGHKVGNVVIEVT